jgi:hypothetical protein
VSTHEAIAAVTATLLVFLEHELSAVVSGARVTARPLDRARTNITVPQLNLFLYETKPNPALRNQELPRGNGSEGAYPTRPALALTLHYLLTSFSDSDEDLASHRLLGKALQVLNDRPVIDPAKLKLPGSELQHQLELVRLTPLDLSIEEISKLWTVFQTQYRVSAAYAASVVLIDPTLPSRSPLPVLNRGRDHLGPEAVVGPGPFLARVAPDVDRPGDTPPNPDRPPAPVPARPGDRLLVSGGGFTGGEVKVRFDHRLLPQPVEVAPTGRATPSWHTVDLPNLPAGFTRVAVIVRRPDRDGVTTNPWTSQEMPLAVAPVITVSPTAAGAGAINLHLTVKPAIIQGQPVTLLWGDEQIPAPKSFAGGSTLTFAVRGKANTTYTVRLRVDGVDSVPLTQPPPGGALQLAFDPNQQVKVT